MPSMFIIKMLTVYSKKPQIYFEILASGSQLYVVTKVIT